MNVVISIGTVYDNVIETQTGVRKTILRPIIVRWDEYRMFARLDTDNAIVNGILNSLIELFPIKIMDV